MANILSNTSNTLDPVLNECYNEVIGEFYAILSNDWTSNNVRRAIWGIFNNPNILDYNKDTVAKQVGKLAAGAKLLVDAKYQAALSQSDQAEKREEYYTALGCTPDVNLQHKFTTITDEDLNALFKEEPAKAALAAYDQSIPAAATPAPVPTHLHQTGGSEEEKGLEASGARTTKPKAEKPAKLTTFQLLSNAGLPYLAAAVLGVTHPKAKDADTNQVSEFILNKVELELRLQKDLVALRTAPEEVEEKGQSREAIRDAALKTAQEAFERAEKWRKEAKFIINNRYKVELASETANLKDLSKNPKNKNESNNEWEKRVKQQVSEFEKTIKDKEEAFKKKNDKQKKENKAALEKAEKAAKNFDPKKPAALKTAQEAFEQAEKLRKEVKFNTNNGFKVELAIGTANLKNLNKNPKNKDESNNDWEKRVKQQVSGFEKTIKDQEEAFKKENDKQKKENKAALEKAEKAAKNFDPKKPETNLEVAEMELRETFNSKIAEIDKQIADLSAKPKKAVAVAAVAAAVVAGKPASGGFLSSTFSRKTNQLQPSPEVAMDNNLMDADAGATPGAVASNGSDRRNDSTTHAQRALTARSGGQLGVDNTGQPAGRSNTPHPRVNDSGGERGLGHV